jgi:hypothetical protein
MKLIVEVDAGREYLGRVTGVASRGPVFGPDDVCATARGKAARAAGNPERDPLRPFGHVPFGTYRFRETRPIPPEHQAEYGSHALVFEPVSGQALDAESYGRLELLIHGGDPGPDGRLRRTNGDLRVDRELLSKLVRAVSGGGALALEVQESKPGLLERLTGRRPRPSDLRARRRDDDGDRDDDDWTDHGWSPSTASDSSMRVAAAAAAGAAGAVAASQLAVAEVPAGEGEDASGEPGGVATDTNY